jgi:phage shock protein A
MKPTNTIQARLGVLKTQHRQLKEHVMLLMQAHRHADAAKVMQRKAALEDQIALLEWVLKP